jgi:hypothetical protein
MHPGHKTCPFCPNDPTQRLYSANDNMLKTDNRKKGYATKQTCIQAARKTVGSNAERFAMRENDANGAAV